jgi:GMP synthase PP-ATPase subunit
MQTTVDIELSVVDAEDAFQKEIKEITENKNDKEQQMRASFIAEKSKDNTKK